MSQQSPVRNTIDHLKLCRKARAQGYQVSFTTDPSWLVNMAINRKAGWFDDPSHTRGSAMPVPVRQVTPNGTIIVRLGKYHKKAIGQHFGELQRISRKLNGNILVRDYELNGLPEVRTRIRPERLTTREDY